MELQASGKIFRLFQSFTPGRKANRQIRAPEEVEYPQHFPRITTGVGTHKKRSRGQNDV